jgi:tetratricopeptide (TPR) repeat protein
MERAGTGTADDATPGRGSFGTRRDVENLVDTATARRLIGWKAIGQFLGCTERTARRWEADRALPVHRIPGGGRSPVWADPNELTAWLQALPSDVQATLRAEATTDAVDAPAAAEPAPTEPPSAPPPAADTSEPAPLATPGSRWAIALLVLIGVGVAIALWQLHARQAAPAAVHAGPYDDNPQARETYMTARFELATRSADSLAAAERGFRQLVGQFPDRATGWSGLADTYLMEREFGALGDEVAYPEAERAARTAVALDPQLADGWLDRAFVEWWWHGDSAAAFRDFGTALSLDPGSAKAHHWYATALSAHGDTAHSLEEIARARTLDPDNRAIVADEAWLRFDAGGRDSGVATLEHLAQLDPGFVSWHYYLAQAYLILGRDEDYLREAQTVARLRAKPDDVERMRLADAQFRNGGRTAMLAQLTTSEAAAFESGTGSAVTVAEFRALDNDRAGMLKWLGVAETRHDHNLSALRGLPEFAAFRADPAFMAIVNRLP